MVTTDENILPLPGEIWKTVPSFPDIEASTCGRIRLKPKQGTTPTGGSRTYGGKPTFGAFEPERKMYFYKYKNRNLTVSRLVCEAFNGPPPPPNHGALHENENSRDNRSSNLRWGTQKENLNYPGFLEYCRSRDNRNLKNSRRDST